MIIVSGTMQIDTAGLDQARAAFIEVMTQTRQEAGCIVYEFSQLVEDETRFRVYEEWESLDALMAHARAPHMAPFRAALKEAGLVSRDIAWMEAGDKTQV